MVAGYGQFVNDNVRTEHLKCSHCRTRVHLTKIDTEADGTEVRSFACQHCNAVSKLRLHSSDADAAEAASVRDLGNR
ncbi:MAG: hypothetical protein JWQ24_865 [Tardiphaga sp.]|nr:hypothetical protein [Tardiphaga sp.]